MCGIVTEMYGDRAERTCIFMLGPPKLNILGLPFSTCVILYNSFI